MGYAKISITIHGEVFKEIKELAEKREIKLGRRFSPISADNYSIRDCYEISCN